MLPEPAKKGWKTVQPEGTVDARITFSGAAKEDVIASQRVPSAPLLASAIDAIPTTQPTQSFEIVLSPRKLSITPRPVPYRLDDLTGTVTITGSTVTLQDLVGRHGDAEVRFSGTGSTDESGTWEFK